MSKKIFKMFYIGIILKKGLQFMVVCLNPIKNIPSVTFHGDAVKSSLSANKNKKADLSEKISQDSDEPKKSNLGPIAKLCYAWINLAEGTKGIAKGLLYGTGTVAVIGGVNLLVSKIKGNIKFKDMLKPWKSLSTKWKVISSIAGLGVLAVNICNARLNANKRTSNVDHMLYEGHRAK